MAGQVDTLPGGSPAPVAPPPGAQPAGPVGADVPDSIRAYVDSRLREGLTQVDRAMRSHGDKALNAVQSQIKGELERIDKTLEELAATGATVTPEQRRILRSQATERILASAAEEPEPAPFPGPPGPPPEPGLPPGLEGVSPDALAAASVAVKVQEQIGVFIEDGDPELQMVDMETNDAWTFVSSVRDATLAKAQRLGLTPHNATPTGRAGRLPGSRSGEGGPMGRSALSLLTEGYARRNQAR